MVNQERLFESLMRLGNIGRTAAGGVSRLALTDLDNEGIAFISALMKEAGLDVRMDAAGSLIGRREGRNGEAPAVLTGSHSDTVAEGGMFDGALGILTAIEAVRCMNERGIVTEHPIEIYAYRDEEGCRFRVGYSSAKFVAGRYDRARLLQSDADGVTVAEVLADIGLDWEKVGEAARPAASIKAHVELHIEQGTVLEAENCPVGVVTGISAATRGKITLTGEAMHAGTTPMTHRRDPLAAAATIMTAIEEEAQRTGTTVATVGRITALPGGINVIPGQVEFSLDCRDISAQTRDGVLERIAARARTICMQRNIGLTIDIFGSTVPRLCSEEVQEPIRQACLKLGLRPFALPSGAGHDSGAFHDVCPMGMIFVRSRGGVSHSPAEWSSPEDCAAGAEVLYHTLLALAVPVASAPGDP